MSSEPLEHNPWNLNDSSLKDLPFVSVIIPVLNDVDRLEICLNALDQQTYPGDRYEVIVVDNGSTESPESLVNKFTQAAFTYESQPGSYAARNQGLSVAKGEIIAFTDSDCIPVQNWLETGVKHLLSTPNCGLVAGQITMFFRNSNVPTAVELYDSITYFQQKKYVEEFKCGATANLFTFKTVFETVGSFNSKLMSGGDLEWGQRVFSRGYSIVYADDSCVAHPARHSLAQLYQKTVRVSRGHYQLDNDKNDSNKYLFTELLSDLSCIRPPLRSTFRKVMLEKQLKNRQQKIQVFFMMVLVHYIKFLEKKRGQFLQIINSFGGE
ncbi:MAG: glycosyltransferase family 2 protein [Cyanobacteria bacterium CRU_2_1]|nr:glycosyltransferase family 2 protein [Cyanobacteria bacterium RU_5_0]NJR60479.1 glycosyltransferase family 2 protein [Cyanobacteria bacterium CRU_2_1]